jgi:cytochrome c553
MNRWILLLATCGMVGAAVAADIDAGRARSAACQSCHGPEGVSLGPEWPNLAGQKPGYLEAQLKAFREGKRKDPLMNAMAAELSDDDIANLAAFFSSLPAGGSGAQASVPAHLAGGRIAFPSGYADSFFAYSKFNRKNGNQVMAVFANQAAVDGMKAVGKPGDGALLIAEIYKIKRSAAGEPIAGADGIWEQGPLAAYAVMEKRSGWGADTPADLRNGDWNYAIFTPEKKPKGGLNQAPCLACHKPLADEDYMFTYKDLVKAAK